jgi:uncharacterized membrane protein
MPETNQAMPKWRRIALPVSIVLNLFLVALIGGHLLHNRARVDVHFVSPLVRALARAEANLPPPDAEKFGAVMRRGAPHYMAAARQLEEARQELARQAAADPFDQEGARRALAAWAKAWDQFLSDFSNTLVEALAEISPESRRKLVTERQAQRGGMSLP